ncbi:MAG: ATP-dependent protease ATPase subunit HslU [Clostridia bacterium]|jgi:ATP-dependent HslUV protease ATP-binding subunit HslU
MSDLTPREIVAELDRYIIGQEKAKKAVAIALRNRYRRSRLPKEMRDEITPKNIIMVGPTGVGKTEIARRLAKLVDAPFVKVEATKFTEVGYVGRDVESMIRDLVEASIRLVKNSKFEEVKDMAARAAETRIVELIVPGLERPKLQNPLEALFGSPSTGNEQDHEKTKQVTLKRQEVLTQLRQGKLEDRIIEIEVEDTGYPSLELIPGMGAEINIQDIFGNIFPKKKKKRKVTVAEARRILEQEEAQKLIDMDDVVNEAIQRAEQDGIIFIDEIDKIAGRSMGAGPDISREGVQRDILPIIEGSTVMTKYGPVKTDYILFIAAGAFHVSKVSDLIPELQGRFPIRVELDNLTQEDFQEILTQPENALIKQYTALLEVDNVKVTFTSDALESIAEVAFLVNERSENIGARRLHTVMEDLLEEISFNAGNFEEMQEVRIDGQYVRQHLQQIIRDKDLRKYIL